jgi:hypothetical protein
MIKYGKIFIRHNEKDMSFFDYFDANIFNNEICINKTKDIGIIFDIEPYKIYGIDEITNIYNTNSNHYYTSGINFDYTKLLTDINYANIEIELKRPQYCDLSGKFILKFKNLFPQINLTLGSGSMYNCIYTTNVDKEIFGIVKINSSNINPIYEFAYDSKLFTINDVIFLIYKLMISR